MNLCEVWLSDEEYNKKIEYLTYAYERIDSELFSSFNLLPLRENNLETSSMFFADICLRLYPLLTIGFNVITFGLAMKGRVTYWIKTNEEGKFQDNMERIDVEKITQSIIELREKNRENKDGIRDYLKFYKHVEWGINEHFDINGAVRPLYRIGRVEYDEKIRPFNGEVFEKYLDTRNSIEHRGTVEAALKEAYYASSALFLLLDTFYKWSSFELESKLFGNTLDQMTASYRRWLEF